MCNLNTRSAGFEVVETVSSVLVFPVGLSLIDSSTCHPLAVLLIPYWNL